jgi:hypothetical protein
LEKRCTFELERYRQITRSNDMANYKELKEALQIERSELDFEIVKQPSLFNDAGELAVEAAAVRDTLKEKLSQKDAELYLKHKELLEEEADKKPSEASIKMAVERDSAHIKATDNYLEAVAEAAKLQILKESFHQRSYMLRELAGLYVSNWFESSSVKPTRNTDAAVSDRKMQRLVEGRAGRNRERVRG